MSSAPYMQARAWWHSRDRGRNESFWGSHLKPFPPTPIWPTNTLQPNATSGWAIMLLTVQAMKIISDRARTYLEKPDGFHIKAWPFWSAQQQCNGTKVEAWPHYKQCTLKQLDTTQSTCTFKKRSFGSYFKHVTFLVRITEKVLWNSTILIKYI